MKKDRYLSKIFGLNKNYNTEILEIEEKNSENWSQENSSDKNEQIIENFSTNVSEEDQTESELERIEGLDDFDTNSQENLDSKEEDLLQIPAFLRRQAN